MSVSDGSQVRRDGFRWVSDQAYQSPMEYVGLRWVSSQACRFPMGLRSGMSVFDGSQMGHPIGLLWVSDNNKIFVNSQMYRIYIFNNYLFEDKINYN